MALTRDYYLARLSPHARMGSSSSPKHSHSRTHTSGRPAATSAAAGSTSASAARSSSSSSHDAPPAEARRRRGRQARPSHLTPRMRRAVHAFAEAVGAPTVVEPAGFRDFRGWLARLSARASRPLWDDLLATVAREVACDPAAVHALKEDIVREVIKCVVVPRPDESAKLVSTNAGRQASRPRSGTTLMVVLEEQLERVDKRLPQLVAHVARAASEEEESGRRRERERPDARLPSVEDILAGKSSREVDRDTLPSFQELDASLRKSRGAGGGSSSRRR